MEPKGRHKSLPYNDCRAELSRHLDLQGQLKPLKQIWRDLLLLNKVNVSIPPPVWNDLDIHSGIGTNPSNSYPGMDAKSEITPASPAL